MGDDVKAGEWWGRRRDTGQYERLPPQAGVPDQVVCRRVIDYNVPIPAGAVTGPCATCGARIAFNPARFPERPHVCMQCAGVRPLPFEA